MFIADTSFPLARHVVGLKNTRTLTVLGCTGDTRMQRYTQITCRRTHHNLWQHSSTSDVYGSEQQWYYRQSTSMILMIPTFKTKTTLVHFVQSAQGTIHLVLLDRMSPDLRHTHRTWSWLSVFVRTLLQPIQRFWCVIRLHGIRIVCYQQAISQQRDHDWCVYHSCSCLERT